MSDDVLLVEKQGRICTVTLNRPDRRNSLNPEMLLQLADTLDALDGDPEIRVVVIRGAGEKAFCAGFDIGKIPNRGPSGDGESQAPSQRVSAAVPMQRGVESVTRYRYPVIAMIYGFAVGAGCDLAASCDLRFAADTAQIGMMPAKLGILYGHQGIQRFIDIVGVGGTKEIFLTGSLLDAHRAKEMGFLNRVVPAAELAFMTYTVARQIAENAPLSVSGTKTTIAKLTSFQRMSAEDEAEVRALGAKCFASEDLKEGQRAFLEKRKPQFRGR